MLKIKTKAEPKIHLAKYFTIREISLMQKARLKARYGAEMHTESEWDEIERKEWHRRLQ